MHERLTHANFLIYCAKHYDNPQCNTTEEFLEDLKRVKYIKKLLTRYTQLGELKERLILNHLIILCNLFGPMHLPRILYLKMAEQFSYVKPFLILLSVLPDKIYDVGDADVVDMDYISMDPTVIAALRKIKDGAA